MLKTIAIDDEPVALEVLKNLSADIPFLDITAYFTNAFDAIPYLQQHPVDLIFLDIKMPDINGIDFLNSLPAVPLTIFTTAYSEHAVRGFELNAIDYLLKPFSFARFLKACNKANEQFELKRRAPTNAVEPISFFVKSGYELVRITASDILYAESMGNYVEFVLEDKKIITRMTMNEVIALLPSTAFIRIHRSCIVAKDRVTRFDKRSIWLGEKELSVSEAYLADVVKFIRS